MSAPSRASRMTALRLTAGLGGSLSDVATTGGLTSGLRARGGVANFVVSPNMDGAIRRLITLGAVTMEQADYAIATETTAAVKRIQARWPVDTGFSRSRWRRLKYGPLQYAIVNDASYAEYVHRKGQTAPLAASLVPAEIETAVTRIKRRLRTLIARRARVTGVAFAAPALP